MEETDQYKSHAKGEATPPASLDDVNHAPGKEGRQGGASRKTWFVLIALVLAAVIIIAVTAGVLLSKDDDDDSEVSTPTASPRGPAEMKLLADVVLPGTDVSDLNQTSPQYLALEWLATEDSRYLIIKDDETELLERFSLATLYYATGGINCTGLDNSKWLSSSSHCDWDPISCENGHIVDIGLDDCGLAGTLPPEIGNFRNARVLDLGWNEIEGSVPTEVGQLTSLMVLRLTTNSIVGTLPTEIGLLKSLEGLILSSNDIGGTLPTEIGHLDQLQDIEVSGNQLVGPIPSEIGNMQQLTYLSVSSNIGLTGVLPEEVGQLESILTLFIQETSVSGGLDDLAFCKNVGSVGFGPVWAECGLDCECCTECCNNGKCD
eukprot:scaffold4001_cov94-Cylindrotheca_fusiformis.AAC.3